MRPCYSQRERDCCFTGGGLNAPTKLAVNHAGNIWIANYGGDITELSGSTGTAISPAGGYTGGGLYYPNDVAVDGVGNVWVTNSSYNLPVAVTELNGSTGAPISPSTGYIPSATLLSDLGGIAIDGSGNVWMAAGAAGVFEMVGAAAPVVTPIAAGVMNNTLGIRP